MSGESELKDAQAFPTDGKITVIGGIDTNGKAQALFVGTDGAISVSASSTSYTEGDTDASITGSALLWEDTADTLRAVSAAKPLPINVTNATLAATQSGAWDVGTVTTITNVVHVDDNASTLSIDDGGGVITVDGTVTVQPGNTANTTPWLVSLQPATTGGTDTSSAVSAASTNATVAKASAGAVFGVCAYNINASPRYLKLYNKASAPSVGSDTPTHRFLIPGNANGAGLNITFPNGIAFSTGISWALTTGITDADNTGVAVSEILVNIQYK